MFHFDERSDSYIFRLYPVLSADVPPTILALLQIVALERAGFIQCEDSINVEDMPYLAILEKDSSLTLFSGLHKMCKVR